MKKYATRELKPGMITVQDIYNGQRQLILEGNTVLTEALISKLLLYGIYEIEAEEPGTEESADSETAGTASGQSYSQRVKQNPEFMKFQVEYSRRVVSLQNAIAEILSANDANLHTDRLLSVIDGLIPAPKSPLNLFDMLQNMRQNDDSIYAHSLNVALLAHMLGRWLRFTREQLNLLTLCGLLHDIGKTALPIELLNKPGKYTDEEFAAVKNHTVLGYQLLQDKPVNFHIKNVALQHHERCDGAGYPYGLKMGQLDNFSMIINITDVYVAMTATRAYRKPLCPFQVIAEFERDGLQRYHPQYILTFLEHIADTYQHNRVLLNNGQGGDIVMINRQHLTKPYIQLSDGSILDMSSHYELEIVSML